MKTTLKITLLLIAGLIGFILLYLVLAYALSRITVKRELPLEEEIEIYIISNGVHTDLVVPIKSDLYDWSKQVCFEHTLSKDTSYHYLAMGWGDKGFYLETPAWKDLKASVAFNAAFGLSSTAIHATFYKTMTVSETCKKINISKAQYQCLINYILDSFQKDKDGRFIHIITKAVYGYNDAFYDAKGSYSLFHTCNTWANNGLKACGQKACLWTPFDTGIFLNYE